MGNRFFRYKTTVYTFFQRKIKHAEDDGDIVSWSTESVWDICRLTGERKKTKKTQDAWAMLAVHLDKVGIGQKQISSLTVQECQQFRVWLTNGNFSQSTQSKYFGLFRSMLKDANMAGHIALSASMIESMRLPGEGPLKNTWHKKSLPGSLRHQSEVHAPERYFFFPALLE
jgi:hypothetical protein